MVRGSAVGLAVVSQPLLTFWVLATSDSPLLALLYYLRDSGSFLSANLQTF